MATRKPKDPPPVTAGSARKDLVRALRGVADAGHQLWRVWSDFVEMSAIALSNAVDVARRDAREARYLQIVGGYKPTQVARFPEALGALAIALQGDPTDVLGSVFMELELGNRWKGQFFTPFHLCRLNAALMIGDGEDLRQRIAGQGYVTVSDPCVGAGAMPMAFALELVGDGFDLGRHLHVTAQDVDTTAVHMAYVQLSLMGVPAVVILGNSLAVEEREHWFTPAHVLGGWSQRLRGETPIGDVLAAVARAAAAEPPANQPTPAVDVQLALPLGDGRAA